MVVFLETFKPMYFQFCGYLFDVDNM